MVLPIARLIQAAQVRGLNDSTPVLLTTDGPSKTRINIIVSKAEPIEVIAPLDLIWIDPETSVARRRVNRGASANYTHTWADATESNFWTAQTWDEPRPSDQDFQELNRNIGNTHDLTAYDLGAFDATGGRFTGAVYPRTLGTGQDYAADEMVPRSFVEKLTSTAQALAASVYQQLTSVRNSVRALGTRTTTVENKVKELELGGGTGVPKYLHTQEDEDLEWLIEHNLGTQNLIIAVALPDGDYMIPAEQAPLDDNNVRITFAAARAGTASIIGIR